RFSLTKNTLVMIVFAILIFASGVSMICKSNPDQSKAGPKRLWASISAGILLGLTTGFVGAGGGFMIVPALIFLLGVPIRMAIGTSLLIIALKSLLGFAADAVVLDGIQWGLLLKFIIAATIGIAVGVRLNQLIPAEKLKVGFGWMVLAVGIGIVVQEFS
ncbi:MAG: sulfite exporter TauE/SafE family protein, partial [Fuerstiella sp.]